MNRLCGRLDAGPLTAAAALARDPRFAVRVLLPTSLPEVVPLAEHVAAQAGVDVAVVPNPAGGTVHFSARHVDRSINSGGGAFPLRLRYVISSTSSNGVPTGRQPVWDPQAAPKRVCAESKPVDLLAFRCAFEALALGDADDLESERIWRGLLRAHTSAHLCGGIPTLVLDDLGGLVGLLRRRAANRHAAIRINPDVCACA